MMILLISLMSILSIFGPYLASKIANSSVNPTRYISFSPSSSFAMSTVTETQVSSLYKALDVNQSSIDIPNKLIKLAAEPLSVPFTKIYYQSIEIGIVPNILKASVSGHPSLQKW